MSNLRLLDMKSLSSDEIVLIESHLDQLAYSSSLKSDLLDHICCDVEIKLEEGYDFNIALKEIFEVFNQEYITQLYNATQFLTNNNTMKTKTIIIGIVGFSMFLLSLGGKYMNITGSNELLILGTGVIVFGFLLSNTLSFTKSFELNLLKKLSWIGFFGMSSVITGTMFSILKQPDLALYSFSLGGILLMVYFLATSMKMKSLLS